MIPKIGFPNNPPENEIAAIYARVSTEEQTRGYSLSTQIDANTQYAASRGYRTIATIQDGYTGESLDRPGIDELRDLVKRQHVDVLIVYDVDRWARKSVFQMILEEEFSGYGVRIEYVNGQYADTDEGRLQKQLKGAISEYEKAKILERLKRGKRGKAKSGFVNVGARTPYGYDVKTEPHKQWLVVNDEEKKIVQLIFKLYTEGDVTISRATRGKKEDQRWSLREIAVHLTNLGILTRGDKQAHVRKKQGVCVWMSAMIRHILINETYIGTWHYGKTQMVRDAKESTRKAKSKRGLGKQVSRSRDEWIEVPVPAIVDVEVSQKAQERLKTNKQAIAGRPVKYQYLLNKRLRCIKCGYAMRASTRKTHRYYHCNGTRQNPPVCDINHSFHIDQIDERAWQWILSMLRDPQSIALGLRGQQAEGEQQNKALYERRLTIENLIVRNEEKLAKILDLYLAGAYDRDTLLSRRSQLEKELADLKSEKANLEEHLGVVIITDKQISMIEALCAEIQLGLNSATFEDKQRYFELLDVRGTLAFEDGKEIVYIKCKLGEQQVLQLQTLPFANIGGT